MMTQMLTVSLWQKGESFVTQCLDVDVATQGESKRRREGKTHPNTG